MSYISVQNLSKGFPFYRKQSGLKASVKNLWAREQQFKEVVKSVSFEVERGEIVAFIGPNGAGKTTTMKMLSGILHPTSGHATVMGFTPWERKKAFKKRFSVVMGQKQQLWPDLPALDSFELNKRIYEIDDAPYRNTLGELSEILNVRHLLDIQVRRLSLGERMKMELIAAMLHQPDVIFLDEPTLGLDFLSQRAILAFLKTLSEEKNTTMLLTSHNMTDIATLCDRALVIQNGGLAFNGELSHLSSFVGAKRHLHIHTHSTLSPGDFSIYGQVVESGPNEIILEVTRQESNVVLTKILSKMDVADINIKEPPLEESLERLYAGTRVSA